MKKTLAIVLALAMVLCMIPVSFAAASVDAGELDLTIEIVTPTGNQYLTSKDDTNTITAEYNYEKLSEVTTGKFTEDKIMALVKVSGLLKMDSVDAIYIDGSKLEVNEDAVYADDIDFNEHSLTGSDPYMLFPIELTKAGYTDTFDIRIEGKGKLVDNDTTVDLVQTAKVTVKLENTSEYKNAKTAKISKIESTDRDEFDAYIVGSKIYLDVVSEKNAEDFLHDLKLTFKDNNGDLFDVVTWAYSASSEAGERLSIFKVEEEGGDKLTDSAMEYTVRLGAAEDNAKLMNDVSFELETQNAIYETKEYDVVVRYGIKEADPKGIYFAESSKTIKIGEEYTPVVMGVATGKKVDATIVPGDRTDLQVIDVTDGETVIGTREGVAYITAEYKPAGMSEYQTYKTNAMKITVTAGNVTDDDDDTDGKTYMVTASSLRVRSGAGTNFSQIGSLKNGATVKVESIANGWAKLENGGYVSAQYLAEVVDNGEAQTMYVTARTLNVRKGPGTSYAKVGTLSRGTAVQVVGFSGNWAKLSNGYYVSTSYLAK